MELLAYKLVHFREASPVDVAYQHVWGAAGLEREKTEPTSAVRSAAHDLNRSLGRQRQMFLHVKNGRVSWDRTFAFCLIACGDLLQWTHPSGRSTTGNSGKQPARE
jgi:hypothetical protein